jgi:hypothetical protein
MQLKFASAAIQPLKITLSTFCALSERICFMSTEVQALVWKFSPHKGSTLIVFLALADWSDDYGKSWPSIAKLAIKTRQSERNTQYCIRELEQDGYLSVIKRKETSSQYIINVGKLEGGAKIAPMPDEGVQNVAEGVQNSAENLRPVAPNTLVIHQKEHTLTNTPTSEKFSLTSGEAISKPKKHVKVLKIDLPDWLPLDEWNGWLEMRVKMRKAATDLAKKYAIEELDALRLSGQNVREVIRRAITKNWLSFYAIPNSNSNGNGSYNGSQSRINGPGATGHLLDHLPSLEENERRRKADDARLAERREKGAKFI